MLVMLSNLSSGQICWARAGIVRKDIVDISHQERISEHNAQVSEY